MFIQIWADRAVSELLDADSGPQAWGTPSISSAPRPSSASSASSSRSYVGEGNSPAASAWPSSPSSQDNGDVTHPPPPPLLSSPMEALLRRCYRLLNPEGLTSSDPIVEFKEVRTPCAPRTAYSYGSP